MRLPVILIQNPPASGAALAQDLVGNLIGRAGLDLTLVDRLDLISPESTDRMTLDGITVPCAVLDWQTSEEIEASLAGLEFHGTRCAHQLDESVEPREGRSRRRLFLFDLNRHRHAKAIIDELDRLKQSLAVKTVSLGSIAGSASPSPSTGPEIARVGKSQSVGGVEPVAIKPSPPSTNLPPEPVPPSQGPLVEASDQDLDRLIDQLDDLDV